MYIYKIKTHLLSEELPLLSVPTLCAPFITVSEKQIVTSG